MKCSVCGEEKPSSAFYPILPHRGRKLDPNEAVERLPKCIECVEAHEKEIIRAAIEICEKWRRQL
jgi:hypothetical protein